jgi:hypothetical protein
MNATEAVPEANESNQHTAATTSPLNSNLRIKTDVLSKCVMRAFRDFLKSLFSDLHGTRYYYWIPATLKTKTEEFFIKDKF